MLLHDVLGAVLTLALATVINCSINTNDGISHAGTPGAASHPKLTGKRCRQTRIGKTPPDDRAIRSVHALPALWFDAVLRVKGIHGVEFRPEAARLYEDVDVVRKIPFGSAMLFVGLCSATSVHAPHLR